ncbi:hypothetical protein LG322_00190 [Microbacterium aerolatum]|uniref:YCII-related domain-containing protein n=1 Tax=Microbacterium saccharophilum TaxID=1213358 RepID=A0A7Z7CY89_9MICO|nr:MULTISPECIES: hypothetical protein [Microbacterium]MDT0181465.1 hypothetical protein [Microbacterium sp. ARD31]SFI31141.1 hypothetical protein SAMN04487751_1042 [Microbacterium saccharophilum]
MSRFVVLDHAAISASEQMQKSEDAGQAEMQAWMAWAQKVGPALVDMGAPLGETATVPATGGGSTASTAVGYSILEAPDLSTAAALMEGHPHLRIGTIQIHQAIAVPGM